MEKLNFNHKKLHKKQLVSVGNYTPRKGFHLLLEGMYYLSQENPELFSQLNLKFVGNKKADPKYSAELAAMAKEFKIEQQIVFEDWKKPGEVKQIFSESDLFIFASQAEGFGMVVLEAMLQI